MKQTFRERLLNDPFGDPCLYVRFAREKRAILFDIGDIRPLTPSELHRVTDVFVSHTHIDHFIGFDLLLRIILRRDIPLNIYGPANIVSNIEGRLAGYNWNLIEDYPTVINVYSFNGKIAKHFRFRAKKRFKKEFLHKQASDGMLLDARDFSVRAIVLDHGTPCLAFSLEEKRQISIDKDRLLKKGLKVGPWLTEFREMVTEGKIDGHIIISGRRRKVSGLMDIAREGQGLKLSYVTDIAMSSKNEKRLIPFIKNSDFFYCEGYFSETDRERAIERMHLTASEAGRIAKKAGTKRLAIMHFSPKYSDNPEMLVREAEAAFGRKVTKGPLRR